MVGFPLGWGRDVRLSIGHRQKSRRSRGEDFIFTAPVEGGGEWVQYITNEEDNKNHLALFTEFRGRGRGNQTKKSPPYHLLDPIGSQYIRAISVTLFMYIYLPTC